MAFRQEIYPNSDLVLSKDYGARGTQMPGESSVCPQGTLQVIPDLHQPRLQNDWEVHPQDSRKERPAAFLGWGPRAGCWRLGEGGLLRGRGSMSKGERL